MKAYLGTTRRGTWATAFTAWLVLLLLSFGVPPPAMSQTCVTPPLGLVSWWPGDGNVDDIHDGNPGTLKGDATFAAGQVGQAFSFDGDGDFVEIDDAANLTPPSSSITLDAWVKPTTLGRFAQVIVSKYNTGAPHFDNSWVLELLGGGNLRFVVTEVPGSVPGPGVHRAVDTDKAVLTEAEWHQDGHRVLRGKRH